MCISVRFNVKDKKEHQWYYQGLLKSLGTLSENAFYKEFYVLSNYLHHGNVGAYAGLLKYFISLDPVESLDDTYLRIYLVELLTLRDTARDTVDAFIHELEKQHRITQRENYTQRY